MIELFAEKEIFYFTIPEVEEYIFYFRFKFSGFTKPDSSDEVKYGAMLKILNKSENKIKNLINLTHSGLFRLKMQSQTFKMDVDNKKQVEGSTENLYYFDYKISFNFETKIAEYHLMPSTNNFVKNTITFSEVFGLENGFSE
ncbi:MAG: hypothetical protein NXI00_01440 [Cytophagales bacterium]|nr:hypothetical protein [Cytophagales bacterium]